MYLKTLQLRGFKSFASATTLEFEPGITAVVGPNGSGKSNVVDALSWVMGEQGVKTLRGGKMEDVIFAGTTGRGPLGRAEVSLTIDNSDGALEIDFSEVTITRTLFRNGGSEYAINGAQCRLLDIQDLLSDTGLGREMHVIVGQNQLDAVLRATPAERRGFIEEAAGVLKHRKRKEKALRKLDGMQGNLLRLQDLLAEICRQLGPLARQAKAAERAHALAATVRDAGLRLLADELCVAQTELTGHLTATRDRAAGLAQAERDLEAVRATLAQRELGAALDSPHLTAAGETLAKLTAQRERLRTLATLATERLRHLGTASPDTGFDLAGLREQVARNNAALAESREQVTAARQAQESATADRDALAAKLMAARAELVAYDRLVTAHRDRVAHLGTATGAARSRVEALAAEIDRLRTEHTQTLARLDRVRSEGEPARVAEPDADADSASPEAAVAAAKSELGTASQVHAGAAAAHAGALSALGQARSSLAGATARADALELSLRHGQGDAAALTEIAGVAGQVLALLEAPSDLQPALVAVLGHVGSAVVTADLAAALEVLEHPIATELGTAAVVFARPAATTVITATDAGEPGLNEPSANEPGLNEPGASAVDADLRRAVAQLGDAGTHILADQVSGPRAHPWAGAALDQLLAGVAVVADVGAGARLLAAVPAATAVTRDGVVLTGGSVRRWTDTGQGLLALRTELVAAQTEGAAAAASVEQAERAVAKAKEHLDGEARALRRASEDFERARSRAQALAQERAKAQAAIAGATQEAERAQTRADQAQVRLDQAQAQLATSAQALEHEQHTAVADPDRQRDLTAAVATLEAELNAARDVETERRITLRGAQERAQSASQRAAASERTLAHQQSAAQRAAEAAARRALAAGRARSVQAVAQGALGLIDHSIARAGEAQAQAQARQLERDREISELRTRVDALSVQVRAVVDQVHGDQLRESSLTAQVEHLSNRGIESFGIDPTELVTQYGPLVPVSTDPDLPYVRAEQEEALAAAQRKLAGLGRINPLALEEYTALEERHQFLAEQLEDLRSSRSDLLSLVTDIDERVERAFASAFADTAIQFERVFTRLFPGGQGKLILDDPEHPLTSGIEIEARPAGKQVKRLSLLSGGERSLTAIAFLVAIFQARPSPFYVLDEVEAALDDVNLGRLLAVFEELRDSSQLIIITHQKRTMQIADALYGVTMAGTGISTVISQRLTPVAG